MIRGRDLDFVVAPVLRGNLAISGLDSGPVEGVHVLAAVCDERDVDRPAGFVVAGAYAF